MKRKWQKIALALCICTASALGFAACGHEHAYAEEITAPTCTAQGYTTYTCECGDTYVGAYVEALGHEFKQYVSDDNATCETDGTKTAVCARSGCKETDTLTVEHSALGHEFKQYVSDDNATFEANGTKSAVCNHSGCKETDVVEELGTMLNATLYFMTDGVGTITGLTDYGKEHCGDLVIPSKIGFEKITAIGSRAFAGCYFLTSVVIPDSVKNIEQTAFSTCVFLRSVVIGDGVMNIGDSAFFACPFLKSIHIGKSVTHIGEGAFYYPSNSLTDITVSPENNSCKTIDGNLYTKDGKTLVQYATAKEVLSFVVPDGVTTINAYAFAGAAYLCSLTISETVKDIGNMAFDGCRLVEVINKSTHITVEKDWSANGGVANYALAIYNAGDTFTGTKISTDKGYIIYTDGAEKILVFYTGTETDLVLPTYVTKINQYAFRNCDSLKSVTIGDGVKSIGEWAFYNCFNLTSVVIPDSVESIGEYAFYNCFNLTSVTMPDSVTSIGEYAFSGCISLTSVYYKGTAEEWAEISIDDSGNSSLTNATRCYYVEKETDVPTDGGNYWHYDENGEITVW